MGKKNVNPARRMKNPPHRSTDAEFEERARRNLVRRDDAVSGQEISYGPDGSEPDDVLDSLDDVFDAPFPADDTPADDKPLTDEEAYTIEKLEREEELARRLELYRWGARRYDRDSEIIQAEAKRRNAALAAHDRRERRDRIMREEGREVRQILIRPEDRKARKAELKRGRYADEKGGDVRRYSDLSAMTDEELAAYNRKEAAFRKAEQRAWEKEEKLLKHAGKTEEEIAADRKIWKAKAPERKLEWERTR